MSFVALKQCDGPPCPRCGCRDVEIYAPPKIRKPAKSLPRPANWKPIADPRWLGWGTTEVGQARCKHCGTPFSFKAKETEQPAPAPLAVPLALPPAAMTQEIKQATGPSHRPTGDQTAHSPHTNEPAASTESAPVVGDDPTVCPECGGKWHPYSTKGKTQYRRCLNEDCGHKGKTIKK